jgi:hypothetical protein
MEQKQMKFRVMFTNEQGGEYALEYKTYDTDIAQRWSQLLEHQVMTDSSVYEKDRFYNFPDNTWTEEHIVNELNACIDVLNQANAGIAERAEVGMSQHLLNVLHHHFENLRGGVLSPGSFWAGANGETKAALERYNVLIHRAENYYNTGAREQHFPRVVCRFNNRERISLEDADYAHFTLAKNFGEVYINYCEVGKPLYDVFKDGDDVVGEDNIRPLRYYAPDFALYFHHTQPYKVDKFLADMDEWWDRNDNYLGALGFTKGDPKNAIGYIPVAALTEIHDIDEVINNLVTHQNIDRVEIIDDK